MVTVQVLCICKVCGEEYTFTKDCPNGLEAEKTRRWAEKNSCTCKKCYITAKQQQFEELTQSLSLPQIQGRSEKQIGFADTLRNQYISRNTERVLYAHKELQKVNPAMVPVAAMKRNLRIEDCVPEAFRRVGFEKEYICLTSSDAGVIIDALKTKIYAK
jgi:hypothetical protein